MAKDLILKIQKLKESEVGQIVRKKMAGFEGIFENDDKVFSELCFCILTANTSAEVGIRIQATLKNRFRTMTGNELAKELKELGYRFPNKRAEYIHEAKKWTDIRKRMLGIEDEFEKREWLVKNVKGIGYKEASHFLRNVGHKNVAILDRHIIRTLYELGMIKKLPKSISKRNYLEYEKMLKKLCKRTSLNQAELDLYLWYLKTGKVLK